MDWADFEEKLRSADLFLLCNPHNPLGIVWTEEELRRMMELCLKHHVLVVSDEIHSDLIFHGKRHIPTASLSPEIAADVVTGISGTKTFNLAGLQASTAVFPNAHMKARSSTNSGPNMDIHRNNAFSVTAMEAAFNEGEEWLEQLLALPVRQLRLCGGLLPKSTFPRSRPVPPTPPTSCGWTAGMLGLSNEALHRLHDPEGKAWASMTAAAFGRSLNGYMRLNAACPRSILEQAMTSAGSCRQQPVRLAVSQ